MPDPDTATTPIRDDPDTGPTPFLSDPVSVPHMHENGADICFIQQMLGHARLDTTQIYTEVNIEHLKEVHARTHPSNQNRKHRSE